MVPHWVGLLAATLGAFQGAIIGVGILHYFPIGGLAAFLSYCGAVLFGVLLGFVETGLIRSVLGRLEWDKNRQEDRPPDNSPRPPENHVG
jgi:hypothetical protein